MNRIELLVTLEDSRNSNAKFHHFIPFSIKQSLNWACIWAQSNRTIESASAGNFIIDKFRSAENKNQQILDQCLQSNRFSSLFFLRFYWHSIQTASIFRCVICSKWTQAEGESGGKDMTKRNSKKSCTKNRFYEFLLTTFYFVFASLLAILLVVVRLGVCLFVFHCRFIYWSTFYRIAIRLCQKSQSIRLSMISSFFHRFKVFVLFFCSSSASAEIKHVFLLCIENDLSNFHFICLPRFNHLNVRCFHQSSRYRRIDKIQCEMILTRVFSFVFFFAASLSLSLCIFHEQINLVFDFILIFYSILISLQNPRHEELL